MAEHYYEGTHKDEKQKPCGERGEAFLLCWSWCLVDFRATSVFLSVRRHWACADTHHKVTPPGEYTCPISCELMVDPVFTATGQTYERECIVRWLRAKQTDPISNAKLPNKKLVPNISLRGLILQWREVHPESTR